MTPKIARFLLQQQPAVRRLSFSFAPPLTLPECC